MKTTRIELKDSGVLFNKERHEYWLGDKQLSGITGMLQRQLFPDEFNNVPEEAIKEAARYGTEVHESRFTGVPMILFLWVTSRLTEQ